MQQTNRFFLGLSFEGTNYHGWQIQPNAPSVQQTVSEALSILLREEVSLTGAGRTDTGVHACDFTAHFDTSWSAEAISHTDVCYKLNRILPTDIAIQSIRQVHQDAHARYSATTRSYQYIISRRKDPFMVNRAWLQERPLDFEAMQQAAKVLLTYDDFQCFSKSNTQVSNYLCRIEQAQWEQKDHLWHFHIRANRFLRNMVRAIVGTLTDVGRQKINMEQLHQIIQSKNRSKAGYSVPGCGLYFMGASYEDRIFKNF